MYLMLTDETNNTPTTAARFFAYGGLVVPGDEIESLTAKIVEIRNDAGYRDTDVLKFDTNVRPAHIDRDTCTNAKSRVIESCSECGCKFIAYLVLHDIARNREPRELVTWAADHVIGRFNMYLHEVDSVGLCVIDSLPVDRQFQYLTDKFTGGLNLDGNIVPLDRIQLFAATVISASHISSAMDIVLGSFRYAINDPQNPQAARAMMVNVVRLMWYREHEGEKYLGDRGLIFRPDPESIRVDAYREQYNNLRAYLQELVDEVD